MKSKGFISNLTILILSFALFISVSIFCLPQKTFAAVTALDAWTNIYTGAPNNSSGTINAGSLTVSGGSDRLFLATVCLELSTSGLLTTMNVTLGGTALTTIGRSAISATEHCYMGYFNESQIPASSKSLSVQYGVFGSGVNVTGIHVKWASYSNVYQTLPINDSSTNNGDATSVTFVGSTTVDYIAQGLTLYVTANCGTSATMTPPSDFSQSNIETTNGQSSFIAATGNPSSGGNYPSSTTVNFVGGTTQSAIVVAAINPSAVTLVGNNNGQPPPDGEPSNATIGPAPNGGATMLDSFTLQTLGGAADDTVTGVTVTLTPTNIYQKLSKVEITSDDGTTSYGHADDPLGSDTVSIPVTGIPTVTGTPVQYRVRITPKSHSDIPAGTYFITGKVTAITSSNPKIYSDSGSASIILDNVNYFNPTGFTGIPGDEKVKLTWTNPSSDFSNVVLLRDTSSSMGTPTDGVQYNVNDPIGTSTVISVVGGAGTPQTLFDAPLTNGENYYYKIFGLDPYGNYSSGVSIGPYTPGPVVTVSSSGTQVTTVNAGTTGNYIGAAFTFQQTSGTAGNITALTISDIGDAVAHTELTPSVKVYYEADVDSGNCVYNGNDPDHEILITTTTFDSSEKLVLSSINIPVTVSSDNSRFTCIYVVFDVNQSALNDTKVDLQITSSADFTISGSAIKDGTVTYPVALSESTNIRSAVTNLVKVGSFQSGISSGYTYVTDVGFKPKAVIFFWTRQDSTGFLSDMSIGEGFATAGPPIVNRSVTGICFDDANPTICGRRKSESYSIIFLKNDVGSPLSGQGQVTSFDSNGFTIYWNNAPGIDTYVNYIAFGGDENFDAQAGTITAPMTLSSPYNVPYTGVGFKPDFVMFLASSNTNVNNDLNINANHMFFNTGFMTPTGQAAVSVRGRNNQTSTGHSTGQQSTNQAIMGLSLNGDQDWLASYVSMGDDGFTLNFSDRPAADTQIYYLALKGGTYKIGTFNQRTTAGTQDTTVGFQPVGLFMASANRYIPSYLQGQILPEGEISIGAVSSSTEDQLDRATIWGETRDIVPPSDANMSVMTDKAIRFATGIGTGTPTINAEADLDSFISNGFRLNWTTVNDTTQRTVVYWAIGNATTTVGDGTDPATTIGPAPDGAPPTPTLLERFTLQTSIGSDKVTAMKVSLSSGSSEGLSYIDIASEDEATIYGSVSYPNITDTVTIPLDTNIDVTTDLATYRIRIRQKYHNDDPKMPDPRGLIYKVTGIVTEITSINTAIYNDANNSYSEYVSIDNESPLNPTNFSGTPGEGQIVLTWTNPLFCTDCSQLVLLRSTSPFTSAEIPVEGAAYSTSSPNNTVGASTVIYVQGTPFTTTWTDTGLISGETYYYKLFVKDSYGNYSSDTTGTVRGAATGPYPVVTASSSGNQVATMEAGDTDQYIGAAFTFQQSSGTAGDITALTISETGSAVTNTEIKNVRVYYKKDVLSCEPIAGWTQVIASFNGSEQIVLGSSIPLSVSPNFTCIYVVFDVDLLTEDGNTVDLEITSSNDFTLSNGLVKVLSSYPSSLALPDTTTIYDTTPPADITDLTVMPGDRVITFNWTNPSDADFKGVRISRDTVDIPADCSTGTDVPGTPGDAGIYTDNTVNNGTRYYYRLCTYDEVPNYSEGVTTAEQPPQIPILSYPATPYDDGKDPDTGDTTTDFTFKVIYTDFEGDAPASGYPKIYIGDNDGYTSYTMSLDTSADTQLWDGDYTNGEQYVYGPIGLGAAQDLRFYFEANAGSGRFTDVAVKLPSTDYNTGPSVYLLQYNNMVGVPKDLNMEGVPPGLPYSSVLGDDSGYSYCVFWVSTGLDTVDGWSGSWQYCFNGNIQNGKGYYIFAKGPNTYRLDEPSEVDNVTADEHVDIRLAPGWTMISNPYNARIELQDVEVARDDNMNGTIEEPDEIYNFDDAVANGWIENSIYEYEGPVTQYSWKAYDEPAVLEPWMGYFIYREDITTTIFLRVNKPVQ